MARKHFFPLFCPPSGNMARKQCSCAKIYFANISSYLYFSPSRQKVSLSPLEKEASINAASSRRLIIELPLDSEHINVLFTDFNLFAGVNNNNSIYLRIINKCLFVF